MKNKINPWSDRVFWEVWAAERTEGYEPTMEDRDDLCFGTDVKSLTDAKQFPPSNCILCSAGGFAMFVCMYCIMDFSFLCLLSFSGERHFVLLLFSK